MFLPFLLLHNAVTPRKIIFQKERLFSRKKDYFPERKTGFQKFHFAPDLPKSEHHYIS